MEGPEKRNEVHDPSTRPERRHDLESLIALGRLEMSC